MLPFFTVFGITISMYGLMIVLGSGMGIFLAVYLPVYKDLSRQDILFSSFYAVIGLVIGAKLIYLITILPNLIRYFDQIEWSVELISELLRGGFVFYGGLIGGVLAVYIYCKQYKLPFFRLLENLIPSVPLIHAIGRTGCFFAGCCYGFQTDSIWGVKFRVDSAAPAGTAFFPVQLLEAGFNLIIFIFLFVYSRRERRPGQITGFYLLCYSIIRFAIEFFRADTERGIWAGLSTSQWISLILMPLSICLVLRKLKFKEKTNIF